MEHRVSRMRAGDVPPFAAKSRDGRLDDLLFLMAKRAILACMRVEAGNRQARMRDPEVVMTPAQEPERARPTASSRLSRLQCAPAVVG
jgi:hypothetical protein